MLNCSGITDLDIKSPKLKVKIKMKSLSKKHRVITIHTLVGAIIGIVLLHPLTKIVYWFEWHFLMGRMESAFVVEMVPMSLAFAIIGGECRSSFCFLPPGA